VDAPPSLWLDAPYTPRAPLRGDHGCDVAIVGGGLMGISLAFDLSGQGLRVRVLEGGVVAGRASGRNAGFVITSLAEPYASLCRRAGHERTRTVWKVNEDNRARIVSLVEDLALDCSFARPGSWCAAASEAEAEQQRASARMLAQDGFDFRWIEPKESEELLGPPGRHGALFRPGDGQIHPARFVRGLAAHAEERGVAIHEGSPVQRLARAGEGWLLQGEGFSVRAPRVVIAANALAPSLHGWFADKIVPVRGQVLATAPLATAPKVPGPVYANEGYEYWRLHEGRLILGGQRPRARGEEHGLDEALNARVQAALDRFLSDNFPGVRAHVTHRWAGIMDFSVDGFPLVGEVPGEPGLLTAVGFTGHGLGYALVCSAWLRGMIMEGRDTVPAGFRADRALDRSLMPP
jgi:glycine/D-amino acid oxidase-like deaminating enzyme